MNNQNLLSIQIQKIKHGDAKAFEALFYTHCKSLIQFANRYLQDMHLAENIVQDVFLHVWEKREKLDPSLNIKTYLYTAVKNRALKQLRHQDVRHKHEHFIKAQDLTIHSAEEQWQQQETEQEILNAIEKLPPKCQLIFSMNRFDGLTYSEIAEVEGISIKTVETQMGRALKTLRKQLAHLLTSLLF